MRPCDHFEPELSAFLDGELPSGEHGAVGAHVESCAACARELERLRAVGVVLRRWDAEETRYATTHAFRSRVLSRVEGGSAPAGAASPAAAAAPPAERAPAARLLFVRAAAAAIVIVATGVAASFVVPSRSGDDVARLEAELAAWRAELAARAEARGRADPPPASAAPSVPRAPWGEPIVTPVEDIGGTPAETAGAPEVWEEHGAERIVQDAFSDYDRFHREQRDLALLAELRRAQATAQASPERPTTDEAPVTPLGRYLGALRVPEGSYAPFQQVQVWPIVRDGAEDERVADAPLTADEALALKALRVREGDGTLVIENRDRRGRSVLLLAGDVFQGGRQDRVAVEDVLLEPGQTRSVRALGTGDERRTLRRTFSRSDGLAPHRVRALLARGAGQTALDRTVAASLPVLGAATGDGSLAGVYDNDQLFSRVDRYVRALQPRLERDSVVGFAVAAGSELLGVEVFADHGTFTAMRTRTLRSYVLEALARPRLVGASPETDVVTAALRHAGRAANSGTSGEVAAFLDPDAGLGGFGLVTAGLVRHAVVFAGEQVDADGIASGRLRGAVGDSAAPLDGRGGEAEPGAGPSRGSDDTNGGLGTGSNR